MGNDPSAARTSAAGRGNVGGSARIAPATERQGRNFSERASHPEPRKSSASFESERSRRNPPPAHAHTTTSNHPHQPTAQSTHHHTAAAIPRTRSSGSSSYNSLPRLSATDTVQDKKPGSRTTSDTSPPTQPKSRHPNHDMRKSLPTEIQHPQKLSRTTSNIEITTAKETPQQQNRAAKQMYAPPFPEAMMEIIFKKLTARDLFNCACVSHYFLVASSSDRLWEPLALADIQVPEIYEALLHEYANLYPSVHLPQHLLFPWLKPFYWKSLYLKYKFQEVLHLRPLIRAVYDYVPRTEREIECTAGNTE